MTARQMARLIDRQAYVSTPDGLVPCTVEDAKLFYGTERLFVTTATAVPGVTKLGLAKSRSTRWVDASRVLIQHPEYDSTLVDVATFLTITGA